MKLRSVIANLLVFLITSLSSAWLFHQAEELRVDGLFHDKTNAWLVTRNGELIKVKL